MSRINDKVVKQIQERLTNDFEIKMFLPGVSPKSRGAFASGLRSIWTCCKEKNKTQED